MKRLSEMTIRQRGRLLFVVYCIPVLYILIQSLALGIWQLVLVALGLVGLNLLFLRGSEKRTRDDPPHANY